MNKIFGVGLPKALALALFTIIVIVMLKVIVTKYPVAGVSEIVQAV